MEFPEDVEATWPEFVRVWCYGTEPSCGPSQTAAAFQTLRRFWPDLLKSASKAASTIFLVEGLVRCAQILRKTEHIAGFASIVARLQHGEFPAFAELEVAEALFRAGFQPTLEPKVDSRVPDLAVTAGGKTILLEVIAPRRSQGETAGVAHLGEIAKQILDESMNTYSEVAVLADLSPSVVDHVVSYVLEVPVDGNIHVKEDLVRTRRCGTRPGEHLELAPSLGTQTISPLFITGSVRSSSQEQSRVSVYSTVTERRVHRLLSAELRHFGRDGRNVVVVQLDSPARLNEWHAWTKRWFQPHRNRRIGAVVIHSHVVYVNPLRHLEYWRVVENPHAYNPIPQDLLIAVAGLDSSFVM